MADAVHRDSELAGEVADDEEGHAEAHEVHSLRAMFRERRIALGTMDRPLRLATAGALASLLGVCLLIALRDIPAPGIYVALRMVNGRRAGENSSEADVAHATAALVNS